VERVRGALKGWGERTLDRFEGVGRREREGRGRGGRGREKDGVWRRDRVAGRVLISTMGVRLDVLLVAMGSC